ncbi:S-layer homology domain-containing protein [Selenomonadales bacterium OttesenSCG-928-I06]|nr:S-layer homology domain-containing protein [Selenomonadales bacterium OttesenSCG-928-I06]
MKKNVVLALAVALSLSVAGTAMAQNPFNDVPQGHWAYDAVAQLEKDGLVTGYGDGTYRGDRAMSRYEMATVVAQIDDANGENAELINRLRSEFATELYNLGVRVDRLEKNASTIKFTADGRIRYQKNGSGSSAIVTKSESARAYSRFQQRIRITMTANINEKVKFIGRVKYENSSNVKSAANKNPGTSHSHDVWMERAEIQWTNGSFQGKFGRIMTNLGQGLIWSNVYPMDGGLIGYKTKKWDVFGGVVDFGAWNLPHGDHAPSASEATMKSKVGSAANIGYNINDKVSITGAYFNSHNENVYPFSQMSFGINAKLGKDWRLMGEYIKNNADLPKSLTKNRDQDHGYWVRLQYKDINMKKPGTYGIYAEYLKLGAYSLDSKVWGHILDIAAGNGWNEQNTKSDGAKGYGINVRYVFAKNMNLQVTFHDLKKYDGSESYRHYYQVATNFAF